MTRRLVGWALAAIGGSAYVTNCVLLVISDTPRLAFYLLWPLPFAVLGALGAFIVTKRPENRTGWLFLVAGICMVANGLAQGFIAHAMHAARPLPGIRVFAWFQMWTWMPALALISAALIVFPTGRAANASWSWVVRLCVVIAGLSGPLAIPVLGASADDLWGRLNADITTVQGGELASPLSFVAPALLIVAMVAVVHRYFRSRGIERLQMKWLVYGATVLALGIAAASATGDIEHPLAAGLVSVGIIAIPLNATIAITRYRLFEIDRVVSRTLTYAVVTVILGGIFVAVVLVPALIVGQRGRAPAWLVALGTLVGAAAFRPVSRRVRLGVDRRFNRARYDAVGMVDGFTRRLRDEIDMGTVIHELEATVREALHPSSASIWIRPSN